MSRLDASASPGSQPQRTTERGSHEAVSLGGSPTLAYPHAQTATVEPGGGSQHFTLSLDG